MQAAALALLVTTSAAGFAETAHAAGSREVTMTFDGFRRGATVTRVAGVGPGLAARVVTAHGGTVTAVRARAGQGRAVRLPQYDGARRGARALLKIVNTTRRDRLDPGRSDFVVRADFRLAAQSSGTRFDDGDNLLQRGDAGTKHQYKIQLDGHQLSCLLENRRGDRFRVAVHADVDARHWYRAQCSRRGTRLVARLTKYQRGGGVAGAWTQELDNGRGLGAIHWANPSAPLTVGGRLTLDGRRIPPSPDQFNGVVDNVVVNILR